MKAHHWVINVTLKPSKKTFSILNKELSEEEHNHYCKKERSTKNRLKEKLAAKQAKTKDSISQQPSSFSSP